MRTPKKQPTSPTRARQLMTPDPQRCDVNDTLKCAARIMWEHDVGVVPLVDEYGHVAGIITDRDICMATYTQGREPGAISARDVMCEDVITVSEDSAIGPIMTLMRSHQLHRIPVLDESRVLVGMLSLADIARSLETTSEIGEREIADTLAAIHAPREERAAA